MTHNKAQVQWKVDQARSYSEQIIDALVEGTNEALELVGDEDETSAMLALMFAIEQKVLIGPDGERNPATVMGTLATAILQLARVERGMPRVTPTPQLD